MRAQRIRPTLREGRFYKILKRVEAIPAGTYRFEGWYGSGFEFSVGAEREVRFMVRAVDDTMIVEVPYTSGQAHRTSTREFLNELYDNIGNDVVVRALGGKESYLESHH